MKPPLLKLADSAKVAWTTTGGRRTGKNQGNKSSFTNLINKSNNNVSLFSRDS